MNTQNQVDYTQLLEKTMRCSRYAKQALNSDASLPDWLAQHYHSPCDRLDIENTFKQLGLALDDENQLATAVRKLRKRVMLKLILRDLNGLADLNEVMTAMTALAEVTVQQAQQCLMASLTAQYGVPCGETDSTPQQLLILGMGKLGGGELNVSSDIDLIFIYPEDGSTQGRRELSNHEFFTRLGRRLINLINEATADGYVFRVDMRLRPYGDSGPLVMSFAALEQYLITQGREWERYAWIKARVISPPDDPQIKELMAMAQPFIFRKYLDFVAIDSMRRLHAQIRQEVQRRERMNNIKLGPGGIREIEFTAQVFQLIRGGQDARLRIRPTQQVLAQLVEIQQLNADSVAALDQAYVFLRNLEHRLQYLDDQQTQELPEKPEDQQLVAEAMGYPDYHSLLAQLDLHREMVSQQFEQIFGQPESDELPVAVWDAETDLPSLSYHLLTLDYQQPSQTAEYLLKIRNSSRYQQLPELSRQRLDRLIPQCIQLCASQPQPDVSLERLMALIENISRRAAYLAFLAEYPQALQRLVKIISASSWASDYLSKHPALLDELLDAREYYQQPDWSQLKQEIQLRLQGCADDIERQLDVLRHIQQEQTFHLLAMDLQGILPLEKLSDHLSDLADLLLQQVLTLSWNTLRKRHCDTPQFAIIAYGKLGGRELGYASDLDIIFLYQDEHPDAQEIYARLGQRINTLLSSHTASGRLYETDLRLRPNGSSGLLVSTVNAFQEYQQHDAWVWEHQALTRARFCAGDPSVGQHFADIRRQVLCQTRPLETLRQEVLTMRQKMHDGHPNNTELFDVKHDAGGMVDIEFMVQYLVLAYAHQHPELTANRGNIALLKIAGELSLIPNELASQSADLYRQLRTIQHQLRLNNHERCRIPKQQLDTSASLALWQYLFGEVQS